MGKQALIKYAGRGQTTPGFSPAPFRRPEANVNEILLIHNPCGFI